MRAILSAFSLFIAPRMRLPENFDCRDRSTIPPTTVCPCSRPSVSCLAFASQPSRHRACSRACSGLPPVRSSCCSVSRCEVFNVAEFHLAKFSICEVSWLIWLGSAFTSTGVILVIELRFCPIRHTLAGTPSSTIGTKVLQRSGKTKRRGGRRRARKWAHRRFPRSLAAPTSLTVLIPEYPIDASLPCGV